MKFWSLIFALTVVNVSHAGKISSGGPSISVVQFKCERRSAYTTLNWFMVAPLTKESEHEQDKVLISWMGIPPELRGTAELAVTSELIFVDDHLEYLIKGNDFKMSIDLRNEGRTAQAKVTFSKETPIVVDYPITCLF